VAADSIGRGWCSNAPLAPVAAAAFISISAAGVVSLGRAGLGGAAALAAVEASLIVFSFVAFGRTLGLRDAARRRRAH
jgi:hypothetical protein